MDTLKELGIVTIGKFPASEIDDEAVEGADATSGNTTKEMKQVAKMEGKFNLLMFVFVVLIVSMILYFAVVVK